MNLNETLAAAGLRARYTPAPPDAAPPAPANLPEYLDHIERELGIHPVLTETAERSADGEPLAVVSGEPQGVQNGN